MKAISRIVKSPTASIKVSVMPVAMIFLIAAQGEAVAADRPSVESILSRYIEVIGGREAVEKLSTRVCVGKEITDLTSRQQPIYESHYFETYTKIPMNSYFESWSDTEIYRRGYDGEAGWIKDKCGVRQDEHVGKRRLDWLLNPQNALRIEEYFPNLTFKGVEQVRGGDVYVLESPELHRPLYFNIESGLLIGFGHNWELHEYREVDGVLFPHRVIMSRKGGSTTYEFIEIRHNVEIDDSLFSMPRADD